MTFIPLIARAKSHQQSVAIRSDDSEHTYRDLVERSGELAMELLGEADDLHETRIGFLLPAGFDYVTTQWAIWRAGGVAVPLSLSATERELEYTLCDSQADCVVTSRSTSEQVGELCRRLEIRLLVIDETSPSAEITLPDVDSDRRALILYTSGTTSRPKGVVTTHTNIQAQIEALVEAWEWQPTDVIPLFLPLHHIHGIINVLSCALWTGATVDAFPRFELDLILERVADEEYSVFMAVPTIYVKLIQKLDSLSDDERSRITSGFSKMRLMVSGSAALPASVHKRWTDLTGQALLERYGMTEIGMGLSNPYHGERRPGVVGQPLPSVEVQLKSEQGAIVTTEGEPGEIQVRGPCVFLEYWDRPDVTADSFDDGWFRTGDMAVIEDGYYRIMGRQSVDIIKSGGYKLSALEIEASLLEHPDVRECAVVGLPDETWGEVVSAAVVLCRDGELNLESLQEWCRHQLSHYKIPKRLVAVDQLPRNAMGKVTKPAVRELF